MRLGVVCGLKREQALVPDVVRSLCLGPGPTKAAAAAEALIAGGCDALISFGTAGGLIAGAEPGTLVVPDTVIGDTADERVTCGPDLAVLIRESATRSGMPLFDPAKGRALVTAARPITTPADKAKLASDTGACAVDMESLAVGQIAAANGIPFAVLRAIADPVHRTIPTWVLGAVDDIGETHPGVVLKALLTSPARVRPLFALASDSGRAEKSLKHTIRGMFRENHDLVGLSAPLKRDLP